MRRRDCTTITRSDTLPAPTDEEAVIRDTASKINDRRRDHKARALTTSDAITRAYHLGRFHAHRDDLDLLEGQL